MACEEPSPDSVVERLSEAGERSTDAGRDLRRQCIREIEAPVATRGLSARLQVGSPPVHRQHDCVFPAACGMAAGADRWLAACRIHCGTRFWAGRWSATASSVACAKRCGPRGRRSKRRWMWCFIPASRFLRCRSPQVAGEVARGLQLALQRAREAQEEKPAKQVEPK